MINSLHISNLFIHCFLNTNGGEKVCRSIWTRMVYKGFLRSLVLSLTLSLWLIKIQKDHEALVSLPLKMGLVVSYGIFC